LILQESGKSPDAVSCGDEQPEIDVANAPAAVTVITMRLISMWCSSLFGLLEMPLVEGECRYLGVALATSAERSSAAQPDRLFAA
jgi:hypothetical protein